jgi:hypothetical protein
MEDRTGGLVGLKAAAPGAGGAWSAPHFQDRVAQLELANQRLRDELAETHTRLRALQDTVTLLEASLAMYGGGAASSDEGV